MRNLRSENVYFGRFRAKSLKGYLSRAEIVNSAKKRVKRLSFPSNIKKFSHGAEIKILFAYNKKMADLGLWVSGDWGGWKRERVAAAGIWWWRSYVATVVSRSRVCGSKDDKSGDDKSGGWSRLLKVAVVMSDFRFTKVTRLKGSGTVKEFRVVATAGVEIERPEVVFSGEWRWSVVFLRWALWWLWYQINAGMYYELYWLIVVTIRVILNYIYNRDITKYTLYYCLIHMI